MSDLPQEAERLLVVAPEEFVAERKRLTNELRDAGRSEEAAAVAQLRKPPPPVLAVNRAARARPKSAEAASDAALRLRSAQVGEDPEAFKSAFTELQGALELLAEVALSHVRSSDEMRRRVYDLLRSAVAVDGAREALTRGALTTEIETAGFDAFAGVVTGRAPRKRERTSPSRSRSADRKRRERERALRDELDLAEGRLREAETSVRAAESLRARAEREVAAIRRKLERLVP